MKSDEIRRAQDVLDFWRDLAIDDVRKELRQLFSALAGAASFGALLSEL